MKKLTALIGIFLFLVGASFSNAQSPTPDTALNGDTSITYTPPLEDINGTTRTVNIKFNDLTNAGVDLYICLKGSTCLEDKLNGIDLDEAIQIGPEGINVCADGENNLKRTNDECGEGDWFHEGKIYRVTLYRDAGMEAKETEAAFYINHFYPTITVAPQSPNLTTPIEVTLSGTRRLDNKGSNNNYQIVVEGTSGYKQIKCVTVKPNESPTTTFDIDGKGLATGSYMIKVNEQVGDSRPLGIGNHCEGGFTFWHVPFTVTPNGGEMGVPVEDPNGSDYKSFNKFLNNLTGSKDIELPCGLQENTADPENKRCAVVNTAIGDIPTAPLDFVLRLFQIVLAIAGAGAMILILYAGIRLLASRGNKEVIQAQRERITAAVVGLLFVVFSLVLLSVVAGDVLKIPGIN